MDIHGEGPGWQMRSGPTPYWTRRGGHRAAKTRSRNSQVRVFTDCKFPFFASNSILPCDVLVRKFLRP